MVDESTDDRASSSATDDHGADAGGENDSDAPGENGTDTTGENGADESARDPLVEDLLAGEQRALARAISRIENRSEGYRDLVGELYANAGDATVIGVTGPPGAGKSTLVDRLVAAYRERDLTVGVIAIDPTSPYSGGAVLGDRIRIGVAAGDDGVFVRSMSTRGSLGGLSTATADAVTAMDAFGFDRIVVETVGAGQNEVDVVRTADTVVLLVPPGGGDDVQMLKAGILEIADCFVVNKADLDGADRTVQRLREMLDERGTSPGGGHHGADVAASTSEAMSSEGATSAMDDEAKSWSPPILETVATNDEGIDHLFETLEDHRAFLDASGEREERTRSRQAATIRRILRSEVRDALEAELENDGRLDDLVDRVVERELDPYTAADEVFAPIADCLEQSNAE